MNQAQVSILNRIGNTPSLKCNDLGGLIKFKNLYLKLENHNPTGTHKDRMALKVLRSAIENGFNGISVGTCGSYGLAIAWLCSIYKIECKIFIPECYRNSAIEKIWDYTNNINFVRGTYEDAVRESIIYCNAYKYFDANPSGVNSELCFESYYQLADEIITEFPDVNLTIWLPIGNATTFTGIYRRLSKLNFNPKYYLIASLNNSSIISSLHKEQIVGLNKRDLKENKYNEPLVSWLPPVNISELLEISSSSNLNLVEISDNELIEASKLLADYESIESPSYSCAGLAGLIRHQYSLSNDDTHLVIVTS